MRVLVTGSRGFIGSALVAALRQRGDEIVPVVRTAPALGEVGLDLEARRLDPSRLPGRTLDGAGIDAAVHLAGASLVGRWTASKKEAIRQSRIAVGDIVARALAAMEQPPAVLVGGFAIGYYGDTGERAVDEGDGSGVGFLPEVCRAWEESANPAREANIRVVNVRTGIVLGDGGVLKMMLPAFRFGLGARLGSGRQWTSWISLEDEVRVLLRAIDDAALGRPSQRHGAGPGPQHRAHRPDRRRRAPAGCPGPAGAVAPSGSRPHGGERDVARQPAGVVAAPHRDGLRLPPRDGRLRRCRRPSHLTGTACLRAPSLAGMQAAGRPATNWNFADVWELCAELRGQDRTAFVHGDRRLSWAEADRRAAGVATALLDAGLGHQAKVAQYLYNCPEYLESVFASFKAGLVPVNVNYRYGDEEVVYLLENSDSEAVVFHGAFSEIASRVRHKLPKVRLWLHVADGSGPVPSFAVAYESAASLLPAGADTSVKGPWGRSPDDLYLLYTGGTTGLPKGVMWRQDDLFAVLNAGSLIQLPDDRGVEGVRQALSALDESPPSLLPACPLMHGTGSFTAFLSLSLGGRIVTLPDRRFDAPQLLDTIASERVNLVTIVGDAFARPIVAALDAEPGRYDLSSLLAIVSSGVMWSEQTKHDLLRHNPNMILVDVFSSSEAIGMGSSVSTSGSEAATASFRLGKDARVLDDDGNDIGPGSNQRGRLAIGGRLPLGYYKDEAKTAATFVTIDGRRFSLPGDFATVGEDGSIQLLGRGSAVINTGGEKVFPEEVEEVLKTHPAVADAACVGVPDDRFGEAVCALVELRAGMSADPPELIAHVEARLARFKVPRYVLAVGSLARSPSGKLDYKTLRQLGVGSLEDLKAQRAALS